MLQPCVLVADVRTALCFAFGMDLVLFAGSICSQSRDLHPSLENGRCQCAADVPQRHLYDGICDIAHNTAAMDTAFYNYGLFVAPTYVMYTSNRLCSVYAASATLSTAVSGAGCTAYGPQMSQTIALNMVEASLATAMSSLSVVWGMLTGYFIFTEMCSAYCSLRCCVVTILSPC